MQVSHSIEEVRIMTGIGRTKLYEAINSGALKARKLGKRTIVLKQDLDSFLITLADYTPSKNKP